MLRDLEPTVRPSEGGALSRLVFELPAYLDQLWLNKAVIKHWLALSHDRTQPDGTVAVMVPVAPNAPMRRTSTR